MEPTEEAIAVDEVTKVMLVEDHPKYRRVVEMAINAEPTIQLVSMFGAAEIALRHVSDAELPDLPNIILLDLHLPGMSGLDALTQFLAVVPEAKIIVLTQSNAEGDIEKAIQSGASGYLLKSSTIQQIVDGIHAVASGGASLDNKVASHLLKMVQNHSQTFEPNVVLSTREREILTLLSRGLLKKEIANELGISYGSVATYIRRLYEKLDVQNAPAAIDKAHRIGVFKHADEPRSAE